MKKERIPLLQQLDQWTSPGTFFDRLENGDVTCYACAHQCHLKPGQRGRCIVRRNTEGILQVPWGYTTGFALDPIEKKPFNHFLPGAMTLSYGMVGCNFQCDFCQNWLSAQAVNDPKIHFSGDYLRKVTEDEIIQSAVHNHAKVVVSTYNEPWITADWSDAVFQQAHKKGLKTAFVSNGFASRKGLEQIAPNLDALKIDLKCGTEDHYRFLGGHLAGVLDTIAAAHELGIWVEVVTLVIPEWNNEPKELWQVARSIMEVSAEIPWHVTAYHPDYRMRDHTSTTSHDLQTAADIGQEAGLQYVYAGNLPGKVGSLEDTHCSHCGKTVVLRRGFQIIRYQINPDGTCPNCGGKIPGIWDQDHPVPHLFV